MSSPELAYLSIGEMADLMARGTLSPVELCEAHLARIRRIDPQLGAYMTVAEGAALEDARRAEAEMRSGTRRGPLHGIPVGLKDNYATAGIPTTAGSRLLEGWIPSYDHAAVERLRAAGAVVLGKHKMHEFAYSGVPSELRFGEIANPWDPRFSPGGSSGGSAAAVAAGLCAAAMGTDGAGSIRRPAAACGIVGLKPTFGRISRRGQVPAPQSSVDHAGTLTRTVRDAALVLRVVAGHDPGDPASARAPVADYAGALTGDVAGIRLGIPSPPLAPMSREVQGAVDDAIATLRRLGMDAREVSLPRADGALTAAIEGPILAAEGHATRLHDVLVERGGSVADLGPETRTNYLVGRLMPASYYVTAQKARRVLLRDFDAALAEVDVIVTPMSLVQGDVTSGLGDQINDFAVGLAFAIVYDLTGLPAVTVPCGFSSAGLPIGLQIAGRRFEEATVLRVADAYERATPWHTRHPVL